MTGLLAIRATGRLAEFNAAGVLSVADVQVAQRVGALAGEHDDTVLLAFALTVRGTRQGSVVLDLATAAESVAPEEEDPDPVELAWPAPGEWVERCAGSPLVLGGDGAAPLRMAGTRLWLARYWKQEAFVAGELLARAGDRPDDLQEDVLERDLAELFPATGDGDQRTAAATAARARVSVIAGGPGTGKTTTIARLIALLLRQRPELRVALAAPTGKAAARLAEAVQGAELPPADRERVAALPAATVHRLLGRRIDSTSRFRHDRENRLPYDIVVVDECSMVSLTLMARLLEALPAAARLVLVGDPDQLASVEAGAVLGDVAPGDEEPAEPLRASVARLRAVRRYEGAIDELARCVRAGDAPRALELLTSGADGLTFHATADDAAPAGPALAAIHALAEHELAIVAAARAGDESTALDLLEQRRLLCAHRTGPRGERHWSEAIERWLVAADPTLAPRLDGRYPGQPLLVTKNDYENQLLNGDTGVVVERAGALWAAFRRGGRADLLPLVRVGDVRPLHALTVHRAQGSQFAEVTVLLPPATSPLATRQTFYTAITRARRQVTVIGSPEAVLASVARPVARATGLRDRLAGRLG